MQHSHRSTEIRTIGSVVLPPGGMKSLHLGMYELAMPEPELTLDLKPNQSDAIGAHVVRLDKGDHYELVYHFQSYSDAPVRVTVENAEQ
ncbi:MAG: hypothetical protein ABIP96_06055 [Patescibacteria group bacterium]